MRSAGSSRLSERALWYRHTWWFQWAHKPLCSSYAQDVLRIGRMRLCRSCAAVYAGAALSSAFVLALAPSVTSLTATWITVTTIAAIGSYPTHYRRRSRVVRDGLRSLLGASIPLAIAPLWSGSILVGVLLIGALLVLRKIYGRVRASVGRTACTNCSEKDSGICSGYAEQAVSIRAYEEELTERYLRAGFVPKPVSPKR